MTKALHTLIIATAHEHPAIVTDAIRAGLGVTHQDRTLHWGDALHVERQWMVFCTEDDFLRFIEHGQP